jgi:hypothetical protein
MEHTDSLCGQNIQFKYVKAGGTYSGVERLVIEC